jgi:predicted CXXCH cytochrome family protein
MKRLDEGGEETQMARRWFTLIFVLMTPAIRMAAGDHPVQLEKNADTPQCLECHEEKKKAAHVHTAIEAGCTACHEVKVDKDNTRVDLVAPKEELCFTCHEKSKEATLHGPYAKGGCVFCHDPHASNFDKQLRAEGNSLCLECHQDRVVKGNLAVFKTSYELSESEFQEVPKIGLDPTLRFGHPMGTHRVADAPDTLHPGQKITCLTCHENHAAAREKLVRTAEYKGKKMDVCDACHLTNDETRMAEAQKRTDVLEAQRQKDEEARQKQPSTMPQKAPRPQKKP